MKLRILGCSGGIGGDSRTTAMLLDEDVLIDTGTGVGELSLEELIGIDHVFITRSGRMRGTIQAAQTGE